MGSVDLRPPSGETCPPWEYSSNLSLLVYHCISILEIAVCTAGFFVLFRGRELCLISALLASDMRSTSR